MQANSSRSHVPTPRCPTSRSLAGPVRLAVVPSHRPDEPSPTSPSGTPAADEVRGVLGRWLCAYREADSALRPGRAWDTLPGLVQRAYVDDGEELLGSLASLGYEIVKTDMEKGWS